MIWKWWHGGGAGGGRIEDAKIFIGSAQDVKIRSAYIRGTAQVGQFEDEVREARLRWFAYVQRGDGGYIRQMMLKIELLGGGKEEDHRGVSERRACQKVGIPGY